MILYKDKRFISNSEYPDTDWVGNADYVIPDGSELAQKIKEAYPYFEFVFDGEDLVDIEETERPPVPPAPPWPLLLHCQSRTQDIFSVRRVYKRRIYRNKPYKPP